ncbi:MAG: YbaB/EbfC family nucleoid-associated protein [Candidatus Magasanikbacteria bacterium]|nr:YbaB/EbfC family nucleoid-associated protein [Candidatus Magasanikbacteria bacterium]
MSVFTKLKQFKDLRDQGKRLQGALSGESATCEAAFGKVSVTMDGSLSITQIKIDDELMSPDKKDKVQSAIKDAHNDALKKMQRTVATKMQQMGGFDLPGMKSS